MSKKTKKTKGKTLALSDFLQETPGAVPTMTIRKSSTNWADEVDENDSYESRPTKNVVLPTAPKASRDYNDIEESIPKNPPYIAFLSNLPFDVDEDEIICLFRNLNVSSMRIPKDDRSGDQARVKGYGYVEFEDRESLIGALVLPDTTVKGRRIRIEPSTENDNNDRRRPGGRMDMNRDRMRPDISNSDWRSGPRVESNEPERRTGSSMPITRDSNREPMKDTDNSNWRSSRSMAMGSSDKMISRSRNTDSLPSSGPITREDMGSYRSAPSNTLGSGHFHRRTDSGNDAADSGPIQRRSDDSSDSYLSRGTNSSHQEPRTRPKLVLAPRTKPIDNPSPVNDPEKSNVSCENDSKPEPVSQSNIFGSAKPVDTSKRERQIEERLVKEQMSVREVSRKEDNNFHHTEETSSPKDQADCNDEDEPTEPQDVHGNKINGIPHQASHVQETVNNGLESENDIDCAKDKDIRREEKHRTEREMPKLKATETPNFIASNKFDILGDDSDSST